MTGTISQRRRATATLGLRSLPTNSRPSGSPSVHVEFTSEALNCFLNQPIGCPWLSVTS